MKEIGGMLAERDIDVKPFTNLQLSDGLDYKLLKSEEDEKLNRIAERRHWGNTTNDFLNFIFCSHGNKMFIF